MLNDDNIFYIYILLSHYIIYIIYQRIAYEWVLNQNKPCFQLVEWTSQTESNSVSQRGGEPSPTLLPPSPTATLNTNRQLGIALSLPLAPSSPDSRPRSKFLLIFAGSFLLLPGR